MPEQSYTLLLDATQSRDQCIKLFQNVAQRIAAYQDVWERVAEERGIKSPGVIRTAVNCTYHPSTSMIYSPVTNHNTLSDIAPGFPQVIANIANDASPMIKTSFDASRGQYDGDTEFIKYHHRDIDRVWFILETEIIDGLDSQRYKT